MIEIDDILAIDSREEFEQAALKLFAFQAACCNPYTRYLSLIGVDPAGVKSIEQIPFMPISLFKSSRVYSFDTPPEITFTSSTTGSLTPSHHYFHHTEDYRRCFRAAFNHFYGRIEERSLYALLPNYLERSGSSLVFMADDLIRSSSGGFFLYDTDSMLQQMQADPKPKILLGVSYALLDLAQKSPVRLDNTIVMETGGMKGRRREMPRAELHSILCDAFAVDAIHSEYGMAELASQAYSNGGGRFRTPEWMQISIRDINSPFKRLPCGITGGVNIIDLGNIASVAFIQTDDLGRVYKDGSFEILGRIDGSVVRGCNLMVE